MVLIFLILAVLFLLGGFFAVKWLVILALMFFLLSYLFHSRV